MLNRRQVEVVIDVIMTLRNQHIDETNNGAAADVLMYHTGYADGLDAALTLLNETVKIAENR